MRKPKLELIANGQYRTRFTVAGKRMVEYFGSDLAEAEMRYAAWWAAYSQAALDKKVSAVVETTGFNVASGLPAVSLDHLTLSELAELYVEWAKDFFQTRANPGYRHEYTTRIVIGILGDLYWSELDTVQFKRFRKTLIGQGKNRIRVNQICTDLITWMTWAYAEKKITHRIDLELRSVKRLKPEDHGVEEKVPKEPVKWNEAEQLLPFLAPNVRAMVTAQFWCGMRPGEVCIMRPMDLLRVPVESPEKVGVEELMYYVPSSHKNSRRTDKKLVKVVGWRAQDALAPLLGQCESDEEFVFKPKEAFSWAIEVEIQDRQSRPCSINRDSPSRVARADELRTTRQKRVADFCRDRFTTGTYSQLIGKGFERAARAGVDLKRWTPNQLRHGVMSQMADNGFERAGSLLLGHSKLTTSLTHYDHVQIERLSRVADRLAEIDPPTDA